MSPKKPNSANRKVAKVNIKNYQDYVNATIKIPGEGHNLQQHSSVLIRGARIKDLIGVNNVAIRNKLDLLPVVGRKTSRSIYGVKKLN